MLAPAVLAQGPKVAKEFLDCRVREGVVRRTEWTEEWHEQWKGHAAILGDPAPYVGPPHFDRSVEFASHDGDRAGGENALGASQAWCADE